MHKKHRAVLLSSVVFLAMFTSCSQEPDVTAPGRVSSLRRASYENGEYRFTWVDPVDSDLVKIEILIQPVGEGKTVDAGVEAAGIAIPQTEQLFLTSVVSVDGSGNESDPVYMVFPGERSDSRVEFYDSASNLTATNVYTYDTNGIETGFTSYSPDPDGTIDFVRERTEFSSFGVFTKETDYDSSDNLVKYSTLTINNETRSLEFSEYDSSDALQYTLSVTLPVDGRIDFASISDPAGNLLQRQYANYDTNGYLTSYVFRDSNDALLETEEYTYDSNGDLSMKNEYDSNNNLFERLEFIE